MSRAGGTTASSIVRPPTEPRWRCWPSPSRRSPRGPGGCRNLRPRCRKPESRSTARRRRRRMIGVAATESPSSFQRPVRGPASGGRQAAADFRGRPVLLRSIGSHHRDDVEAIIVVLPTTSSRFGIVTPPSWASSAAPSSRAVERSGGDQANALEAARGLHARGYPRWRLAAARRRTRRSRLRGGRTRPAVVPGIPVRTR